MTTFDHETRKEIYETILRGQAGEREMDYIHALEQIVYSAKGFWHALYLDSCLTTPKQVGAEARFQQAMEKVRWMRED